MQPQICPRCKFRITSAKAICNTCGYTLQAGRRVPEPVVTVSRPAQQSSASPSQGQSMISSSARVNSSASSQTAAAASMRKTQANAPSGGSFWRTFLGLDPLPADSPDRDDRALGET